ncbi:hypothetical protein GALMADRAFT_1146463 [Galerina marginata CBS 339.88]|uniref:Uncharacterized protein n=1 Tax=Galerina marginata (strain CBS 339.88) TaxID=685588 RepID=A0A067SFS4_GALM3|nr:hypothetical protein GALMADRAFT_1146463 [Galerina marginata CBS 339.88]
MLTGSTPWEKPFVEHTHAHRDVCTPANTKYAQGALSSQRGWRGHSFVASRMKNCIHCTSSRHCAVMSVDTGPALARYSMLVSVWSAAREPALKLRQCKLSDRSSSCQAEALGYVRRLEGSKCRNRRTTMISEQAKMELESNMPFFLGLRFASFGWPSPWSYFLDILIDHVLIAPRLGPT